MLFKGKQEGGEMRGVPRLTGQPEPGLNNSTQVTFEDGANKGVEIPMPPPIVATNGIDRASPSERRQ
jgi:hypothetical protein